MADGAATVDQGALNFSRGIGSGGGAAGPDDGKNTEEDANSKDMVEWAASGGGRALAVAHKLVLGPIGVNLSKFGKVSLSYIFGGDAEGFAGKNIMPGSGLLPETQGGVLYQIVKAVFRNRELTDHTGGIGGNTPASEGGGGDSGSWGSGGSSVQDGQGFASFAASSGLADMFIAAGGGNHFEPLDVPMSRLGTLTPQTFSEAIVGRGQGMSLA